MSPISKLALAALAFTATSVVAPAPAQAATPQWCSPSWDDYFDHSVGMRGGDWLYGENRANDVGFKGFIDTSIDELDVDGFTGANGYEGSAVVDRNGIVSLSGNFTDIQPVAYGYDCNNPATLRFFIEAEINGAASYVWRW